MLPAPFILLLHLFRNLLLPLPEIACDCREISIQHAFENGPESGHWTREISLPAEGRFVEESHYVTDADSFGGGRSFPEGQSEEMEAHLQRSLELYRAYEPKIQVEELYGQAWERVWTPSEGGHIGQGSIGERQLTELDPETELWLLTMMWAKGAKPEPGTKFLLSANDRFVVAVAGFETGPASNRFLGGITPELHHYLGTGNHSIIRVGLLADQNVPVGPVNCRQAD